MNAWNYNAFLNEALTQIQNEFNEKEKGTEFAMWFNLNYVESRELVIVVSMYSKFLKDSFENKGYKKLVEDKIYDICGQNIKLEIIISKVQKNTESVTSNESVSVEKKESIKTEEKKPIVQKKKHPQLLERYTLDNFVTGDLNQFGKNVAIAAAKNPGKSYNPILYYGGVGLGKTHLMQAIGNEIYKTSDANIICTTAEEFTNEFIRALHNDTIQAFKNKYRKADVLLIDDIHFLLGKEGCQEELFHTFEALYQESKQMVFTCDRPAKELKDMSDRLRSRFERGLNINLQFPKYETRYAILKKKCEEENFEVDDEVLDFIAKNVETNIRDLESALKTVHAYEELMKQHVTLEIAQQQLGSMLSAQKENFITIDVIKKVVAGKYGLTVKDLENHSRTKNIATPRHYAVYLSSVLTEYSTTEIGKEFGGRDHSTIMNSIAKIKNEMKVDASVEPLLNLLIKDIKEYKNK